MLKKSRGRNFSEKGQNPQKREIFFSESKVIHWSTKNDLKITFVDENDHKSSHRLTKDVLESHENAQQKQKRIHFDHSCLMFFINDMERFYFKVL